jgi:hypothetical protein
MLGTASAVLSDFTFNNGWRVDQHPRTPCFSATSMAGPESPQPAVARVMKTVIRQSAVTRSLQMHANRLNITLLPIDCMPR